jgi:hypothetical protein
MIHQIILINHYYNNYYFILCSNIPPSIFINIEYYIILHMSKPTEFKFIACSPYGSVVPNHIGCYDCRSGKRYCDTYTDTSCCVGCYKGDGYCRRIEGYCEPRCYPRLPCPPKPCHRKDRCRCRDHYRRKPEECHCRDKHHHRR